MYTLVLPIPRTYPRLPAQLLGCALLYFAHGAGISICKNEAARDQNLSGYIRARHPAVNACSVGEFALADRQNLRSAVFETRPRLDQFRFGNSEVCGRESSLTRVRAFGPRGSRLDGHA